MLCKVNSNFNHCLFNEIPSASVRVPLVVFCFCQSTLSCVLLLSEFPELCFSVFRGADACGVAIAIYK